jgi:hypothetical protein
MHGGALPLHSIVSTAIVRVGGVRTAVSRRHKISAGVHAILTTL